MDASWVLICLIHHTPYSVPPYKGSSVLGTKTGVVGIRLLVVFGSRDHELILRAHFPGRLEPTAVPRNLSKRYLGYLLAQSTIRVHLTPLTHYLSFRLFLLVIPDSPSFSLWQSPNHDHSKKDSIYRKFPVANPFTRLLRICLSFALFLCPTRPHLTCSETLLLSLFVIYWIVEIMLSGLVMQP